ncbi:hypothetical protein HOLleu_39280 [Holothuria leucospilota]|uniref:Uncharacterized protein n=1 Tax=Holothuria leucospilota TaxID=206669 RepID=A0A9Q1BBN6_HOLLE|nr:hypothetical protein HOLleu_39280 [Holothuria leucospilota]
MRPEYSQVSDSLQILFVHIPMTGGTAIESSPLFEDQQKKLGGHYIGGHHNISPFMDPAFQNYHKFGMIRHPCSRIISVWQYFSNNMGNKIDETWVTKYFNETTLSSFDAFVDVLFTRGVPFIENECHLQSQVGMIFNEDERCGLDQLLVYERWDESFEKLGERIKVDKHIFKTIEKPVVDQFVCKDKYTPITWSKIRTLYAMDFCVLGYSTDILEENTAPLLINLTSEILYYRHRKCRIQTKSKSVDQGYDHHVSKLPGNAQCTIYTYFQKDPDTNPDSVNENNKILYLWEKAWSLAGWKPRILTEEDAKRHPNYEELRRKFWAFPTVNRKEYEIACFMRYLAMATVGGGWMSDYDVLPFRLSGCTEPLNEGGYTVYDSFVPSLVSGTSQEFTRVANVMADVDWTAQPKHFSVKNKPHVSDMHCHAKMVNDKLITSMKVVISPQVLFVSPFTCNRTTSEFSLDSIPVGFPRMPWAVHFSHHSISLLHKRNLTHLGDQYFDLKSISRSDFMKIAYSFLQENCF